jgi:RNA polymerase sigma-70 factor (ECF subfamily)
MHASDGQVAKCTKIVYIHYMPHLNYGTAARAPAPLVSPKQWSVISAAGEQDSLQCAEAVDRLCADFWHPLNDFARRLGNSPADAHDLTQGFFLRLLERRLMARAERPGGHTRSFLFVAFKNFLTNEHERATALKRGGGKPLVPFHELEAKGRYGQEPAHDTLPETEFDRQWALTQVENALKLLRADYAASGRGPLFDLLKDYVWGGQNALTLAEIAGRLDLTEGAVKKAVQRLRHRVRDCLRAEVAHTVSTPDQIDDELRHLRAALST